jgi:hypothetical protein
MRGSLVVLALVVSPLVATVADAQKPADPGAQKCVVRVRGNPSGMGAINRADPTLRGNKNCPPLVVGPGTISGFLFNDALYPNGSKDDDEVGISGWTVTLSGAASLSTKSAGDGSYSFTNLPAGSYTLCVTPMSGWNQVTSGDGTCPSGVGYNIEIPDWGVVIEYTGINFGYISQ